MPTLPDGRAPEGLSSALLAAGCALLLALAGTPLAIAAARKTGFLDAPGGDLKKHDAATPYLGGMAVFVPFLTAAALVFQLDQRWLGVLLAATLAALLGLMDDFGAMRPGVKLAGQAIIVLVLLKADVRIALDVLPTWMSLVLTALWMLAVMNAVNFLDIMDGVAATVGLVASAFFLAIAILTHQLAMAGISAALLGALAGYLRYSVPKARIFLGDCGSLFLGTTLGALALALDYSQVSPWAVFSPLLVLAIPLFEIAFTVGVRVVRGRPPWRGSPDHVVLRLRRLGHPVGRILAILALSGLASGALGVLLLRASAGLAQAVIGGSVVAALVAAGYLLRAKEAPTKV